MAWGVKEKTGDDLVYGFLYNRSLRGEMRDWQFWRLVEGRIIEKLEESGFTPEQARDNSRLKNDAELQSEIIRLARTKQYRELDELVVSLFDGEQNGDLEFLIQVVLSLSIGGKVVSDDLQEAVHKKVKDNFPLIYEKWKEERPYVETMIKDL
jgi:hypothetical protein